MIIVINSQGGLVSIQDEYLHQGSTKLNKIDLVAPFADNVIFKANFEMPDGTIKPDDLDGYLFQPSMKIVEDLNVWKLPITFPITQDYGIVTMQVRGYVGDTVVCTTNIKLPIQKGVPYASNFEELSDKDQLLQTIENLKALLNTKVDKVNYTIKKAERINEYTEGVYLVYDDEMEQYVTKNLPQEYVKGTEYWEILNSGRIVNVDNELYIEYVDNKTNQSMKLKIEKDKATLNDKQIVVFDDLKASNIHYDNSNSEMQADDTQEALDELMSKLKQMEFAQSIDLGEIKLLVSGWQEVDGIYQYEFTHEKFTNASIQSLMITPNEETINLLNNSDILLYPEVDIQQKEENVAVAIIKADSKPTFEITANFKIMSVKPDTKVNEIKATMVTFAPTDKINKTTVQGAIKQVQANLDDYQTRQDDFNSYLDEENETRRQDVYEIIEGTKTVGKSKEAESCEKTDNANYCVPTLGFENDSNFFSALKKSYTSGLIITKHKEVDGEVDEYDEFIVSSKKSMLTPRNSVNAELGTINTDKMINKNSVVNIPLNTTTPYGKGRNSVDYDETTTGNLYDYAHQVLEFRLKFSTDSTGSELYKQVADYVKVKINFSAHTYTFAYYATDTNGNIYVFNIQFKLNSSSTSRSVDMKILSGYNITTQTALNDCYVYVDNIFSVIE